MARIGSEKKAPEIVEHVMRPFLKDLGGYFDVHLRIHKAHVVMLGERGLLAPDEAAEVLGALRRLGEAGAGGMDLHPDTDLYMQMEAFVRAHAPRAGGKMHMGRSRNDLYACAARMMTRDKLSEVIGSVLSLQEAVLARAREHAGTVMPGYTHLQHAEPVTLGHFLLAFHDALSRDVLRLAAAYETANRNALGAAALAGSSLALDRDRTTDLLGFDGLVENAYDAVAGRDYILQAATAVAVLASTVARVVDTMIVWSTSEFGMLEMPDSYAYTSSIMPQKRNPGYFFESVRSKAARVEGDLAGAFFTLKGTTFIQSRETSFEVTVPVFRAMGEARGAVEVMRGVIASMIVRAERMRENCAGEFSGATEIANFLVKDHGLDFRSAYQVVASMVRVAHERNLRPADVDAALIDDLARSELGRAVGMSDEQVRRALDPAGNVELKVTAGSPCRAEMLRMLADRESAHGSAVEAHRVRLQQPQDADGRLEAAMGGWH
jgi:argininosuccinate lyase